MLLSPLRVWINNLVEMYDKNNAYYMPKEEAYEKLKDFTKQDFGYDVEAWEKWFSEEAQLYRNQDE